LAGDRGSPCRQSRSTASSCTLRPRHPGRTPTRKVSPSRVHSRAESSSPTNTGSIGEEQVYPSSMFLRSSPRHQLPKGTVHVEFLTLTADPVGYSSRISPTNPLSHFKIGLHSCTKPSRNASACRLRQSWSRVRSY
jgi:hypothetical protein